MKACPHDNIGILPVLPGRELVHDAARSSVGRFAERPDLAVMALVFVAAAFANAFAMVRPSAAPGFAAIVVAALGLAAATSARGTWPRLALGLVPLGLAMWTAHFGFHLLTGWTSALPAFVQAMHLGTPRWTPGASLPSAGTLLGLQLALLDAGLLLSLYVAWRVAPGGRKFLPWATVAAGLWLAGAWIYLQPMPLRGMVH